MTAYPTVSPTASPDVPIESALDVDLSSLSPSDESDSSYWWIAVLVAALLLLCCILVILFGCKRRPKDEEQQKPESIPTVVSALPTDLAEDNRLAHADRVGLSPLYNNSSAWGDVDNIDDDPEYGPISPRGVVRDNARYVGRDNSANMYTLQWDEASDFMHEDSNDIFDDYGEHEHESWT